MKPTPEQIERAARSMWRSRQRRATRAKISLADWDEETDALRNDVREEASAALTSSPGPSMTRDEALPHFEAVISVLRGLKDHEPRIVAGLIMSSFQALGLIDIDEKTSRSSAPTLNHGKR